jgi:hypothetical protein
MTQPRPSDAAAVCLSNFIEAVGKRVWTKRLVDLRARCRTGQRAARVLAQRYAIELTLDRLRGAEAGTANGPAERAILRIAAEAVRTWRRLDKLGRDRMRAAMVAALSGDETLVGLFHMFRVACLQRARGFDVDYAGFVSGAPFDLLIARDGIEAEVSCDVLSAEEGRDVHRGAWVQLIDRIDPDLQTWLADHPGRYLLKLTLPQGLRADRDDAQTLSVLHTRIRTMLEGSRRADYDEAAVLRLDPLMLAAAQASELGLMSSLRREFGHQAHLAVTSAGQGVFVMAARAGREDEIAIALRRRLAAVAPARLTGTRPGILAMFVEDTDKVEWRHLRDQLELEGEARHFLTHPEARPVVAVTCSSRFELFDVPPPDAAEEGELRFRNPSHPAAKTAALAPAVLSSL